MVKLGRPATIPAPEAGIHPPFLYICPLPFPFAWFDKLTTNGPHHSRSPL